MRGRLPRIEAFRLRQQIGRDVAVDEQHSRALRISVVGVEADYRIDGVLHPASRVRRGQIVARVAIDAQRIRPFGRWPYQPDLIVRDMTALADAV